MGWQQRGWGTGRAWGWSSHPQCLWVGWHEPGWGPAPRSHGAPHSRGAGQQAPGGWRGLGRPWSCVGWGGGCQGPQRSLAGIRLLRRKQLFLSRSVCLHGREQGNEESCGEITSLMGSPLHVSAVRGCQRAAAERENRHTVWESWCTHGCWVSGTGCPGCPVLQAPSPAGHVCYIPGRCFSGSAAGRKSCSRCRQALLGPSSSSSSCAPCYLIGFVMLERQSPSGLCCALTSVISQLASAPWQPTSE